MKFLFMLRKLNTKTIMALLFSLINGGVIMNFCVLVDILAAVVQFVERLVFAYQLPSRDKIQCRFNIFVSTGLHYLQKSKSVKMSLRIALVEIVSL